MAPGNARGGDPPKDATGATDPTLLRRLKLLAVCLFLTAIAFSIDPERIVGDTKLDLTINPLGFLERALHLWDGAYFGQLQNQAYGYLFPNGPFHALLIALDMPEWVVQRLWMAILMCAAFLGVVQVARAMGIGTTHTQIVAGIAYALAPRVLTLLSYNSAELQPTMLLPWVLLPLVLGARRGHSPRRAALLSAVAFLFCGGTNAASELAILVVPLLYLLTRSGGPRKRRLLAWWLPAILLVSLWWLVPLLIMGRYVFSFMPYTEDAATTTSVASLINAMRGAANWMGYVPVQGQPALPAGAELSTTPWLVAVTAIVAGLGVAGLANRRIPERTFLIVTLLTGVAIVVSGHTGALTGPMAETMRSLYDGPLSPFRNIHKFDAVIRLPMVLGLAYLPLAIAARTAARPGGTSRVLGLPTGLARRAAAGSCAVAVAASLTPIATVGIATRGGFEDVPDYWRDAAAWIDSRGGHGMTMAVPGSARGEYLWGRPMDEPLQPLLAGRWTNHQIIPWGSAGVSRVLHEIDQRLATGRGSAGLADTLARMGVEYLLVRNDLQREGNNGAWPGRVHQALGDSPGITHVRGFGPQVGTLDTLPATRWYDQPQTALDVYRVEDFAPLVGTVAQESTLRVTGGPEAVLFLAEEGLLDDDRPVLLGDEPGADAVGPESTIVTDTYRRREVVYPDVRRNVSATLTSEEKPERDTPAPDATDPAWDPYTVTAAYHGIENVTASTSEAGALAEAGSRDPGRSPFAALDGDDATSWRSSGFRGAVGEWLQVDLAEPRDISGLTVAFERFPDAPPPSEVEVITDSGRVRVALEDTSAAQELAVPPGETSTVRIRVAALAWEPEYRFGSRVGITELAVPGVRPSRTLTVPGIPEAHTTVLTGSTGTAPGCMAGSRVWVCNPELEVQGEDAHSFDRTFTLAESAAGGQHTISGRIVATDTRALQNAANRASDYPHVTSSSTAVDHPAAIARNAFDSDASTVWYPDPGDPAPSVEVDLGERVEIGGLQISFPRGDAITAPVRVRVETSTTSREGWLDGGGSLGFAPVTTDHLTITFDPPEGQPLEIEGIGIPGVEPLGPVEDREVSTACGLGPVLRVNGERVETRIVGGGLRDQLAGRPLEYESCAGVELAGGENRVSVDPGDQYRVESAVIRRDGGRGGGDPDPVRMVEVSEVHGWGATRRSLSVDVAEDSYLVVNENFNEGWEARIDGEPDPLVPVRLDGWRQAWELPAGTTGTITLTYAPDTAYRAALGGGAALALAVVAGALARPRRSLPAGPPDPPAGTSRAVPGHLENGSGPGEPERPRRSGAAGLPPAGAGVIGPAMLVPLALLFGVWVAGAAGAVVTGAALLASWWLGRAASPGKALQKARGMALALAVARAVASPWVPAGALALAGCSLAVGTYLQLHLPFHAVSGLLAEPLRGAVPQVLCLPALARLLVSLWRFDGRGARTTTRPAGAAGAGDEPSPRAGVPA